MTGSGQPSGTPPGSQPVPGPNWAPTPQESATEDAPPAAPPDAPAASVPSTSDVAATMKPGATPLAAIPTTPIGMAFQQPATAVPARSVYNPTPPVKATVKRSASCLGMAVLTISLGAAIVLLASAYLH